MRLLKTPQKPQDNASFDSGLNVLFLAAFPLVLWMFKGSAVGVATALVQMFLFSMALRLISRGQREQRAYEAVTVAHAPRAPRKIIGSILIGIMVLILAGHHFVSLHMPLLFGVIATGLSLAAFGLDPMRDKGLDDPEVLRQQEDAAFAKKIDAALTDQVETIADLGDADLTRRTEAARAMVLRLLRTMGNDPDDLRSLRKPVTKFVQILGIEIDQLEDVWETDQYLFARRRYTAKLAVLTESFEERVRKGGARSGKDPFDMEADLLLDRMRHETAA